MREGIELDRVSEVEYASNPATLEQFIVSKIAEGIMKGAALDEWMRQIRIMLIITMIGVIIHLLIFMQKSGMLSQIKIPGL
jgi:F0F1-type ATP synthase assembly protein I